jgi:ferredoxin-NADP reductase
MIQHEPLLLRVKQIEGLSPGLKRVALEAADGGQLPVASAGAHLTLTLQAPERTFRNSYSIVSDASVQRDHYALIVRRVPTSRGGSAFVHERLAVGDTLTATVPLNLFPLRAGGRKRLLIGGGIGVTPLLSFVGAMRQMGERFELHQFARADEQDVFTHLFETLGSKDIHVHASRDAVDLADLFARQPLGTDIYMCGPDALMQAVDAAADAVGWPASHIHRESFGAVGGAPFKARLARSNIEIEVGDNQSLLEAIEDAGVSARSLCRGGACGECVTTLLEGEADHHDLFLSDEEKASGTLIMPCVSRAKSALLVLDL